MHERVTEGGWRADRRAALAMRIEIAALELFAEQGIESVTVEEIAAAAGISRRSFYRYFNDIDEIISAMPTRSLRRLSHDMHARPPSEGVREAFLGAWRETKVSEEHARILRLATSAFRKSPDAWWRALAKMRPTTTEFYQQMVADRLRMAGDDPSSAGLLANVLIAVADEVLRISSDVESSSVRLEQAFDSLVRHLGSKT